MTSVTSRSRSTHGRRTGCRPPSPDRIGGVPRPGPATAVRARIGDGRCPVVARILTFGAAGPDTPRERFAPHARPRLPSLRPDHEPVTSTTGLLPHMIPRV